MNNPRTWRDQLDPNAIARQSLEQLTQPLGDAAASGDVPPRQPLHFLILGLLGVLPQQSTDADADRVVGCFD